MYLFVRTQAEGDLLFLICVQWFAFFIFNFIFLRVTSPLFTTSCLLLCCWAVSIGVSRPWEDFSWRFVPLCVEGRTAQAGDSRVGMQRYSSEVVVSLFSSFAHICAFWRSKTGSGVLVAGRVEWLLDSFVVLNVICFVKIENDVFVILVA